jgi:hypothetical protein
VEGVQGFPELHFCLGSFCLADVPVLGDIFFSHSLMTYGAYALGQIHWWSLCAAVPLAQYPGKL